MMQKFYKPNNTTLLYLNSSFNCVKSSTISLAIQTAGSGYTSAPTITITSASGDAGSGASATCSLTSGAISSITQNNGSGYNALPTITLSGGGLPGVITNFSGLIGGSGYALPPTLTISGGGSGTGFAGYTTLTPTSVASIVITNGGTGYSVGDFLTFNTTGGGSNASAVVSTVASGVITGLTLLGGGSGYTRAPTISITSISNGTGAVLTCLLTATSVGGIVITSGGSNYSSAVSFVFTPVSGGTGASATPTINLGTAAVIVPSFLKTFSYTWNVPDIQINDLARLSALNIISTNFNTATPYTYRINNLQYDSRDSFFSDYGYPILSMAQNVNVCSYGSLGAGDFCIILTTQTIKQIVISVDDSITAKSSGQAAAINFVIALEIVEYNPEYQQTTDTYAEAFSNRLKPHFT